MTGDGERRSSKGIWSRLPLYSARCLLSMHINWASCHISHHLGSRRTDTSLPRGLAFELVPIHPRRFSWRPSEHLPTDRARSIDCMTICVLQELARHYRIAPFLMQSGPGPAKLPAFDNCGDHTIQCPIFLESNKRRWVRKGRFVD